MALSDADALRGQRIKAVRDARNETQPQFAAALQAVSGERYDASEVSRLESGNRVATWDDVRAIAALDPKQRGRDWLGWDVASSSAPIPLEIEHEVRGLKQPGPPLPGKRRPPEANVQRKGPRADPPLGSPRRRPGHRERGS